MSFNEITGGGYTSSIYRLIFLFNDNSTESAVLKMFSPKKIDFIVSKYISELSAEEKV